MGNNKQDYIIQLIKQDISTIFPSAIYTGLQHFDVQPVFVSKLQKKNDLKI